MLNAVLKRFFAPDTQQENAHNAYLALVAQARRPEFFERWAVPDTLDGRFDVIVLHLFMLVHVLRANGSPEALEFARLVSETFFSDMDRSLREMGSTDTGTGMRVKKMAQAFYGRVQAYSEGLAAGQLAPALQKNLYRGAEVDEATLKEVAGYVQKHLSHLQTNGQAEEILKGKVVFGA